MWHVSFVAVWQPCELLYTYYLLGYYRTLFLAVHMEQTLKIEIDTKLWKWILVFKQ